MANGSFGLSGLPSAPTTVSGSSSIVTPFTQTEVTLASVNGFSSGDLVYQYNGDYQAINSTAASSATFPVETQKVINFGGGSGTGGFQYVLSNRFNKSKKNVATLSNGNVVWTYLKWASGPTYYPYFTITDENNNVVVAETLIEAVTPPNNQTGPSVVALSGGGFVIAWVNASNYIRYGVYTSTGTVTTALQNDTSVTAYSGNYEFDLAARPVSGGFVFTVLENSTLIIKHRVYGATGTATYAWTSNNTLPSVNGWPRVAVRSDDSFIVISMNNSTNTYIYYMWSSTNTAVTNSNFSAIPTAAFQQDVCALTNDVYILVAGTSSGIFYRTLTGTTLSGTSVRVTPGTTAVSNYCNVRALTNGGWAIVYNCPNFDVTPGFISNAVFVNVYNSASTLLSVTYKGSSTSYVGYPYNFIIGAANQNTYYGITETTNYIHVTTDGYSSSSKTMQWARFNKTTYIPVAFASTAKSSTNTSALSTGAYAPSASTPTSAAFYAGSTGSVGWSNAQPTSATVNAATFDVDTQIQVLQYTDSATLSNGNVVLCYSGYYGTPTAYFNRFVLFNSDGTQITPITSLSSGNMGPMRVVGLTDGKFAMFTQGILYVYNNSGLQLSSLAVTYTVDSNHAINMSGLSGGRFVVFANASSAASYYLQFTVYDSSLNVLFGPVTVDAANSYPNNLATIGNNIYPMHAPSGTGFINRISEYIETSTNTWTLATGPTSMTGGYPNNSKAFGLANGSIIRSYHDGTSTTTLVQLTQDGSAYVNLTYSGYSPGTVANSTFQFTPTSGGNLVGLVVPNASISTQLQLIYARAGATSAATAITISSNFYSNGAIPTIASLPGEKVMLFFVGTNGVTSNGIMRAAIVNMGNFDGTQPYIAGTTTSNASLALSPATGFRLAGVATSTAPAGGTGTVAINGAATLNSSYQSIASPGQSFDFSGPVAFGAAGSVIGRNVTLQGNV